MAWMKRRRFAGVTLDQEVVPISDKAAKNVKTAKPKLRFKDAAERLAHRMNMARRHFIRMFNATFRPGDIYGTPTFDDEHEVHTFAEARHIRTLYRRKLRRACPDGVFVIVMGRGKSTARIHFHIVAQGVPQEVLEKLWTWGKVQSVRALRAHNYYEKNGVKVDHGPDFTGLATYLFNHWTEEQGGHYYMPSGNVRQSDDEEPTNAKRRYSDKHPPEAPDGYIYIGRDTTPYGYSCYHYIWDPEAAAEPWRPRGLRKR